MKRLTGQTEEVLTSLGNQRTDGKACLKEIGCVGSELNPYPTNVENRVSS
jgi:hypothetical protein